MTPRMQDILTTIVAILGLAALVGMIVGSMWLHFAAPCSVVSHFTTVTDLPARCFMGVRS